MFVCSYVRVYMIAIAPHLIFSFYISHDGVLHGRGGRPPMIAKGEQSRAEAEAATVTAAELSHTLTGARTLCLYGTLLLLPPSDGVCVLVCVFICGPCLSVCTDGCSELIQGCIPHTLRAKQK